MDCDLQHLPEKLPEMYTLWQQGWEVINGVKMDRGWESSLHSFAARSFCKIMSRTVQMDISHTSDFKVMDRRVVETLLAMSEHKTFFRALVAWAGFRTTKVEFCVADGFTTVIILMLLIGSILMISLGIIGYYIAQIFIEVKARPRYLVARVCNQEREEQA